MIVDIVFAAGCFWGVEKHFENMSGVLDVKTGYVGGNYPNPTYKNILRYKNQTNNSSKIINHTEAVKIQYDTDKISAKKLIQSFWELHNPTQINRQGADIGNNYRSAIYWTTKKQQKISIVTKLQYQSLLSHYGFGSIVTQIKPLKKFWYAENYHQNYLQKNINGYCPNNSTGIKFKQ